jgi:hypothetical protein
MDERELQDILIVLIQKLIDARNDIEDDDNPLADIARDMIDNKQQITGVATFEEVGLLTRDDGLLITTADGSTFQLAIVRSH